MNLEQTQVFAKTYPEIYHLLASLKLFADDVVRWYKPADCETVVVEIKGSLTAYEIKVISKSNLFCGIFGSDQSSNLKLEFYS